MSLAEWANHAITVIRPGAIDDRGTALPDWQHPASVVVIERCHVQPGTSDETLAARTSVIVRWTVYAPAGTDVTAHDAVEIDGTRYAIDGEPQRWVSPTRRLDHVRILLIDWEG